MRTGHLAALLMVLVCLHLAYCSVVSEKVKRPHLLSGDDSLICQAFPIQALTVGIPTTIFGTVVGAPVTEDNCLEGGMPSVWYSLQPAPFSKINLSTCNNYTDFATLLVLESGDCEIFECLESSVYACPSGGSFITFTSDAQTSIYYIGVRGYPSDLGNFQLTVTLDAPPSPPPPPSKCPEAVVVPGPYFFPYKIAGGNQVPEPSQVKTCGVAAGDRAVWYKFSPAPGYPMTISTCSRVTKFDTYISIFGECDQCLTFNDNNCTVTNSFASTVRFTPPTTGPFYAVVSGARQSTGYYQLFVQQELVPGYDCEYSTVHDVGYPGKSQVSGATSSGASLTSTLCSSEQGSAYWILVNVTQTADIIISACDPATDFDVVLSVYSGSCGNLSCLAFNDKGCSDMSNKLTLKRNAGDQFYVVVSGHGGAGGNFTITFDTFPTK